MTASPKSFTILAAIGVLAAFAPACSKSHGETESGSGEKPHDFIRYDPNHAPHDFIKIETVQEASGASSISLPGRVMCCCQICKNSSRPPMLTAPDRPEGP